MSQALSSLALSFRNSANSSCKELDLFVVCSHASARTGLLSGSAEGTMKGPHGAESSTTSVLSRASCSQGLCIIRALLEAQQCHSLLQHGQCSALHSPWRDERTAGCNLILRLTGNSVTFFSSSSLAVRRHSPAPDAVPFVTPTRCQPSECSRAAVAEALAVQEPAPARALAPQGRLVSKVLEGLDLAL